MNQIFEDPNTDAVLLVDASNAFNSFNRKVALRNIHTSCPALYIYQLSLSTPTDRMFHFSLEDRETLFSQEGTTQGDPLAMAMYALAITPLSNELKDDASMVGR
jgi:hypothetical protein